MRTAYGNLAGAVGIACNALLCAAKLLVGTLFGSISVTADAVNNLSDASSSIITLVGFKLSAKPADKEHPYGHARIEYLAGLAVSVLIIVIGFELARTSLDKILHPTPVAFSWLTVAVLVGSIGVKLWMAVFNRAIGRRIGSSTLQATATDSRNDVISTAAVLAALALGQATHLVLDGWMGLAVALFILYSGIGLIKETVDPLLGEAPSEELTQYIARKVLSYEGVLGTHDLMVHDYGPGRCFASVHVEMAAEKDVLESHDIIGIFTTTTTSILSSTMTPSRRGTVRWARCAPGWRASCKPFRPSFPCTISAPCAGPRTPTSFSMWWCPQAFRWGTRRCARAFSSLRSKRTPKK